MKVQRAANKVAVKEREPFLILDTEVHPPQIVESAFSMERATKAINRLCEHAEKIKQPYGYMVAHIDEVECIDGDNSKG